MCYDHIERLYYSAGYPSICIYCGEDQTADKPELYPQWKDCPDKEQVSEIEYFVLLIVSTTFLTLFLAHFLSCFLEK